VNNKNHTNQDTRLALIVAAQRIKSISWNVEWKRDKVLEISFDRLQEFFRRSALWRQELNYHDDYWPFWDIGLHVNSSVRADEDIIEDMKQHLRLSKVILEVVICEWYLHWVALKISGNLDRFTLQNPYEPLIQMYEGGSGTIYQEHLYVDIQGVRAPIYKWTEYLGLADKRQ
jgi:hypothetical protein